MENPFNEQQTLPQRPTFLTVLCILTFIGSGWGVLSNLFSVFTSGFMDNASVHMEQYSNMVNGLEDQSSSSFMSGFLNSSMEMLRATAEHAKEIAIIGMVLSLVSLLGGILMFQLRRPGFYIYTAAQILMLFILPYFAGFSTVVIMGMLWSAFFAAIFIVMYALNLKYMH